jgi:hypothetical protein
LNIGVIGWGSLIWCPGSLRIKTKWRTGGPMLPIEFARISDDGRLTLVIHPGSAPQQTYWAVSDLTDLEDARRNLKEREGCRDTAVHYLSQDGAHAPILPAVAKELTTWLANHKKEVQAVIWTGLKTNWPAKRCRAFSPEDAMRYLEELDATHTRTKLVYDRAKEYIQKAPVSIQTEVRTLAHRRGWKDARLPAALFEGHQGARSLDQIQICRGFTDKQWDKLRLSLIDANGKVLRNEEAWKCAIEVFDRRMRERFFSCIDSLEQADTRPQYINVPEDAPPDCSTLPPESAMTPGFAIMALCCLLIETLQTFRAGKPKPIRPDRCPSSGTCVNPFSGTNQAFKAFLQRPGGTFEGAFQNDLASKFVNGVRNRIVHNAETKEWVIWRDNPDGKICEEKNGIYILDRTRFCNKLRKEYKSYLEELCNPKNDELKPNFVNGMDDIVDKCRK